jgi:cyclophilin family peptidyl-prolyl cis-trans isomerase
LILVTLLAPGCGGQPDLPAEKGDDPSAKKEGAGPKNPAGPQQPVAPRGVDAKTFAFLHQPFAEATVSDAPDGQILPGRTKNGKSVGKLYTEVKNLWDKVRFVTPAGKRVRYTATVKTDRGTIVIALRPDLAPNHVRSFLALARAHYYDGLVFERTVHLVAEDDPDVKLDYVQAGCPQGTGEEGYGSIGYWLKPEFSDQVRHGPGTVGCWHEKEADTAGCKFYITLTKAPVMDGNFTVFGKVKSGLGVVRQIAAGPVVRDGFNDHPKRPVVIRRVTVQAREVNK